MEREALIKMNSTGSTRPNYSKAETSAPQTSAEEVSAEEIVRMIEAGEPIQIMDVRAPEKVATGRIDLVSDRHFHNMRGSQLLHTTSVEETGLAPDVPVVVTCGAGRDSSVLAAHLTRLGLDAKSLRGGLAAWFRLTIPRILDAPEGLDSLVQFDRIGKGCLGYLLASESEAIIVDPPFRSDAYIAFLEESGAELVGVFDTHVHADYVSGAATLAENYGVPYYLHPADAVYPYDGRLGAVSHVPIADGAVIPLGRTEVTVCHTPGHTEGSVSYLIEDRVALTGDFLFVESIGRPDLGGREAEWAIALWESVERAKAEWSGSTAVYPAHYSSQSERRMGSAVGAAFESLLEHNPNLRIPNRDAFLKEIMDQNALFPEAYKKIKALNLRLAPIRENEVEELEVGRNECALGGV